MNTKLSQVHNFHLSQVHNFHFFTKTLKVCKCRTYTKQQAKMKSSKPQIRTKATVEERELINMIRDHKLNELGDIKIEKIDKSLIKKKRESELKRITKELGTNWFGPRPRAITLFRQGFRPQ